LCRTGLSPVPSDVEEEEEGDRNEQLEDGKTKGDQGDIGGEQEDKAVEDGTVVQEQSMWKEEKKQKRQEEMVKLAAARQLHTDASKLTADFLVGYCIYILHLGYCVYI